MNIVFLRESPPFAQDEIVDMAHAVDDICAVLEIAPDDAPALKSIAERVVEHASRGERDPAVLAEQVISEMRDAKA
jgi:hypothetical protein